MKDVTQEFINDDGIFDKEKLDKDLREQFQDETGKAPVFSNREPHISYIHWLENRIEKAVKIERERMMEAIKDNCTFNNKGDLQDFIISLMANEKQDAMSKKRGNDNK